jgi:hypothetical protein
MIDFGQWSMVNGQWSMVNRQWAMGNGQWAIKLNFNEETNKPGTNGLFLD